MGSKEVGDRIVGVCVIRTECLDGRRRVTVTATPDISGAPGRGRHAASTEEALELVALFLSTPCPPEEARGRVGRRGDREDS